MLPEKTAKKHPVEHAVSFFSFIYKHRILALLLVATLLSLQTHWMVMREWHMPTYGNTMIHVASARHIIEHSEYPLVDYSYGGGIPNLYVPLYRILVATIAILTGFSLDFTSRFLVLIFGMLLPLGFFILGRKLFGENTGVIAALLAVLPGEMLIYTVRPLPQAFGLILLPFAFHAIFSKKWKVGLFLTFAITLTHQEAIAFLVGGLGMYFGFVILHLLWKAIFSSRPNFEKHSSILKLLMACAILAIITYLGWQFVMIGHINIFELAQFKNHEGNTTSMDSYLLKTGNLVAALSLAGIFICIGVFVRYILEDWKGMASELRVGFSAFILFLVAAFGTYFVLNNFSIQRNTSLVSISFPFFLGPLAGSETVIISLIAGILGVVLIKVLERSKPFMAHDRFAYIFLFALFIAGFAAVKNDAVGLRVFMDRFVVYIQQPLILLAAMGANSFIELFNELHKKT